MAPLWGAFGFCASRRSTSQFDSIRFQLSKSLRGTCLPRTDCCFWGHLMIIPPQEINEKSKLIKSFFSFTFSLARLELMIFVCLLFPHFQMEIDVSEIKGEWSRWPAGSQRGLSSITRAWDTQTCNYHVSKYVRFEICPWRRKKNLLCIRNIGRHDYAILGR